LHDEGKDLEALSLALRGYEAARRSLGEDDDLTSRYRIEIAELMVSTGRSQEATARAKSDIDGAKRNHGWRSKEVASHYVHLGHILFTMEKFGEALTPLDKGIFIMEKAGLHDHIDLGFAYYLKGAILTREREEAEADECFQRSNPILYDHLATHSSQALTGTWLRMRHSLEVGDLDQAEGLIESCFDLNARWGGEEPFIDQEPISCKAEVMWRKGVVREAVSLYIRSHHLSIAFQSDRGIGDLMKAVEVLRTIGDHGGAVALLRGFLDNIPDWISNKDWLTLKWNEELIRCSLDAGDFTTAIRIAENSLAMWRQHLGEKSISYAAALMDLGWTVFRSGETSRGMGLIEEGKGIYDDAPNRMRDPGPFQYMGYMQELSVERGDLVTAWQLSKDRFKSFYHSGVRDLAYPGIEALNIRREMAMLCFRLKGSDPIGIRYAENLVREVIARQCLFFVPEHVLNAKAMVDLSEILFAQDRREAARGVCLRARAVLERDLVPGHPLLARAASLQDMYGA